jgi:ribosome-associated protein
MTEKRTKTKRRTSVTKPKKTRKQPGALTEIAIAALEDMKAVNVKVLDVRKLTDIADTMIVATGTSDRHVKSIAGRLVERCQQAGHRPHGIEGEREGEWVLVDLQDLIVHVMLPRIREFYGLEKLWDLRPSLRAPRLA